MGWLYVDDGFPEHPKALAAGGDACWLWVCAFAYVNRNHSEGFIPKAMVSRLSDRKNPAKLARQLVDVGLWEDKGDTFYMHDYETWNASAIERKAKARKAAETRWKRARSNAPPDALSNAQASAEHTAEHCEGNANAMPSPIPIPIPSSNSVSDNFKVGSIPGVLETESEHRRATDFVRRMAATIAAAGAKPRPVELCSVVHWALKHLDWLVVDECIGQCDTLTQKPRSASYYAKTLRQWGAERSVEMPEWAP